ncbi:MAG: nucleotidyltransferase domain-containing protein [Proteobacteria bacterium]|nr:nucleotidyltransferase domain-containing protein [Pseudomonadota bacterium]
MKETFDKQIEEICKRYAIEEMYVFGSRALEIAAKIRGREVAGQFPKSDVDIGVRPACGRSLSVKDKVQLAIELEDLLSIPRADIVVLPEAGPFLALDVIRGELIYCGDPDRQAENEIYILRRAGDLAYYEKEKIRQILG